MDNNENIISELENINCEAVIIDNLNGKKSLIKKIKDLSEVKINIVFFIIDSFIKEGRGESNIGSVNFLVIHPLTFEEFLYNTNNVLYNSFLSIKSPFDIDYNLNNELINSYMDYCFIGGMPEVVESYIKNGIDFDKTRSLQTSILENIINKLQEYYKTTEYKNLFKIINLIFPTLLRENKKFKLSDISQSKRYSTFNKYFKTLENLFIITKSTSVSSNQLIEDEKSFILYFFDTGLLGALNKIPQVMYSSDTPNPFYFAVLLNSIGGNLINQTEIKVHYWSRNMSKIEFLLVRSSNILSIELKDDSSGKLKSLYSFNEKFNSAKLIRLNTQIPQIKGNIRIFPFYLIESIIRNFINL